VSLSFDLIELAARGEIHVSWAQALAPVQEELNDLATFLETEQRAGIAVLPATVNILRVFRMPVEDVRVLIVGQDPYPTAGHAIGRSFAVAAHVRPFPRSLTNIFAELVSDTGTTPPPDGDLERWSDQGVMLLNRVLSVREGEAGSHRGRGWEVITDQAIRILEARNLPLVAILWGAHAATLRPLLGSTPIIGSAHPSPLSARRGFFTSRPFTRTNAFLVQQGAIPIIW
jgi:uracil-DNA glycosylase